MKIIMIDIKKINPAKYNPREISPYQFTGLCESIKKFGLTQPLIVNKITNTLVSGHQRVKAAEALGFTHVPVTYVELSEAEEKALNITMNNKAISGDFTETLKQLLLEIKTDLGDEQLFALNLDATLKDLATFEPNIEPEEEEEPTTKEKLRIIIECSNTDEHIELFQEFVGRGLSVRVA